jgi:hypothetical protein
MRALFRQAADAADLAAAASAHWNISPSSASLRNPWTCEQGPPSSATGRQLPAAGVCSGTPQCAESRASDDDEFDRVMGRRKVLYK